MKLTAHILQGMYYALRCAEPFSRYRLPHPSKVQFRVTRSAMNFGDYEPDPHTITVSRENNKTYSVAMQTVAHEMCHLALERSGEPHHHNHDSTFNALGAEVCDCWGWNFKEF